jgi:hypothetical protein
MSLSKRLRTVFVESPNSFGAKARRRRWDLLLTRFPEIESMRVVDLGGTTDYWLRAPIRPRHVTVLNLTEPGESDQDWLVPITGDACDAVAVLSAATGVSSYDLVVSNAVLEHVGGHGPRSRFADSIRTLAPRYWVQTPYRYFPLEPHWLAPGMQFLPMAARVRVARVWPLAHTPSHDMEDALSSVQWTELLSRTEMRGYFPEAELVDERAVGLTKSLVAIRDGRSR